ncbi:MAG: amino acid adenylation domain-containing protein, partial [Desulfobacterales bacterium]|nr:amino acid adenylation domain-containing protein [Desulfobacterales bacterium]
VDWDRLPLHPQVDEIVGDFTGMRWLVVSSSHLSFAQKTRAHHRRLREQKIHRAVSGFPALRKQMGRARPAPAAFPVVFTHSPPRAGAPLPGGVRKGFGVTRTPGVDLDLLLFERGRLLDVRWDFRKDALPGRTTRNMFTLYTRFIQFLADHPEKWEHTRGREWLLKETESIEGRIMTPNVKTPDPGRGPAADYPRGKCLHEYIEEQVLRTPDNIAVRCADRRLTFEALNRRADRVADHLVEQGLTSNQRVGVCMHRSLEMVVGLLAALKAGGAYLPIDPEYPRERIRYILRDAGVRCLLTQESHQHLFDDFQGAALSLDRPPDRTAPPREKKRPGAAKPDDLAYVIYTSGSTGKPKGCMITHAAIENRIFWMQDAFPLDETDRILQKTPFTFDVSVWEFFWPLLTGSAIIMARPGGHMDAGYLTGLIEKEKVTTLHFVPSMLRFFLQDPGVSRCGSIRRVFTSGEALPHPLMKRCLEKIDAPLHNLYGPTEAAVDVTHWPCAPREDEKVPIGRPVANTRIHILDQALKPVGPGEAGELHIAGAQVGAGYLNRFELTREKFIPDPFSSRRGARMYKTGDQARFLPDGNIEYLGRLDFQVKLRGFRIELGEIESVLVKHPHVQEAAALVKEASTADPKLVAYIVPVNGKAPSSRELRDFVKSRLPEHMVPNRTALITDPPVTAHGKLDRKALPWPIDPGAPADAAPPRQENEARRENAIREENAAREGIALEYFPPPAGSAPGESEGRDPGERPISHARFSRFLSLLKSEEIDGENRCRYPSAGIKYAVQTYIHVKENAAENLAGGLYYYHPHEHALHPVSPGAAIHRDR